MVYGDGIVEDFSLEDNLLKRLSTDKGICSMMEGGGSIVYV